MFRVISYYTPDYEHRKEVLVKSLENFEVDYFISEVPSRGSWVSNCAYKPEFIYKHLVAGGSPVVWIDIDARVLQDPILFDHIHEDFACYKLPRPRGLEVLSGTLFFNNTPGAKSLLKNWLDRQRRHPEEWDQRNLANVMRTTEHSFYELPAAYCQIFDTMKDVLHPVIQHYQESRRFRR